MKQINKVSIGLFFLFAIILCSPALVVADSYTDTQINGGATNDTPYNGAENTEVTWIEREDAGGLVNQINFTADLDRSSYSPNELMLLSSSAMMSINSGYVPGISVKASLNGSGNTETLLDNSGGQKNIFGGAYFPAPATAGDYNIVVNIGVQTFTSTSVPGVCDASNGDYIEKQNQYDGLGNIVKPGGYWVCITNPPAPIVTLTKSNFIVINSVTIPFKVENSVVNLATMDVWSMPVSGVKNEAIDSGSKTTIHWLADGLGQGAYCTSPQMPGQTFNYPSGSFETNIINSQTVYTITCKDNNGNTTTNNTSTGTTPAQQFTVSHGAESVSIGGLNWRDYVYDNQNYTKICPEWAGEMAKQPGDDYMAMECHVDPKNTDITKLPQLGTIIFGNNNPSIESLKGYAQSPTALKYGDVPAQKFIAQADGNYRIDFIASGNMKVKIPNRGAFVSAVNYYLKINDQVFSMAPQNSGGDCLPLFSPNSQYSITSVADCGNLLNYQFSNMVKYSGHSEKTTPYDINFSKIVNLKAGDVIEIKGSIFGWAYNTSTMRSDYVQEIQFFLDTKATNLSIKKQAVTSTTVAGTSISGSTTVSIKGASIWVYSKPSSGLNVGVINGTIKKGDQTNIHWEASGLSSNAYCTSPDYVNLSTKIREPNTKLLYPIGQFMTENLPVNKEYTVSCKDEETTINDAGGVSKDSSGATGGSACFIADTLVALTDGTAKNIQDIKVGDVLKGEKTNNIVLGFHQPKLGDKKLYSFNGGKYFVTAEHPFMTKEGWKSINPKLTLSENIGINVSELKVGDTLVTDKGNVLLKTIDSISDRNDTQLYNFILTGDHTYYADGYLVHNKTADCNTGTCGTSGPVAPDTTSSGTGGSGTGGGYTCNYTYTTGKGADNVSSGYHCTVNM